MSVRSLPIMELREPLLSALARQRRLILTAPTGSGKSTQVPQMLLDGGLLDGGPAVSEATAGKQVVILQPRRLPARILAAWVAKSRGVKLGEEVGYQDSPRRCHLARHADPLRHRRRVAAADALRRETARCQRNHI